MDWVRDNVELWRPLAEALGLIVLLWAATWWWSKEGSENRSTTKRVLSLWIGTALLGWLWTVLTQPAWVAALLIVAGLVLGRNSWTRINSDVPPTDPRWAAAAVLVVVGVGLLLSFDSATSTWRWTAALVGSLLFVTGVATLDPRGTSAALEQPPAADAPKPQEKPATPHLPPPIAMAACVLGAGLVLWSIPGAETVERWYNAARPMVRDMVGVALVFLGLFWVHTGLKNLANRDQISFTRHWGGLGSSGSGWELSGESAGAMLRLLVAVTLTAVGLGLLLTPDTAASNPDSTAAESSR